MHRSETTAAFDSWAGRWREHYREDGIMRDRVERFTRSLAPRVPKGGQVLDFGCGTGEIANALNEQGWQVVGCDASEEMLRRAREFPSIEWRRVELSDGDALPFGAGAFDAVVASSVLEYADVPEHVLTEFARITKPGGHLFTTVPDPRHPERAKEQRKLLLARWTPFRWLVRHTRWADEFRYLRLSRNRFSADAWRELVEAAGFKTEPLGRCDHPLAMIVGTRADDTSRPS